MLHANSLRSRMKSLSVFKAFLGNHQSKLICSRGKTMPRLKKVYKEQIYD